MIVASSSVMGAAERLGRGRGRPGMIARPVSSTASRRHAPPRRPPMFNRTTLWILVVALAAAIGVWAGHRWFAGPAAPAMPQTQAVRLFPEPRTLPAFSLQQSDGTRLVPGELQGHWTI